MLQKLDRMFFASYSKGTRGVPGVPGVKVNLRSKLFPLVPCYGHDQHNFRFIYLLTMRVIFCICIYILTFIKVIVYTRNLLVFRRYDNY